MKEYLLHQIIDMNSENKQNKNEEIDVFEQMKRKGTVMEIIKDFDD